MSPELQNLLRDTSRSFYLTLRVLPHSVRAQIGLAYLLARATDTVADTELIPVADRLRALDELRARILGQRTSPVDFSGLAASQAPGAAEAERRLLGRLEEAIGRLAELSAADHADVCRVLETITGGQILDLERFGDPQGGLRALATGEELEDYTYRVAGCVGEFWTRITRRHCFPAADLNDGTFLEDGIRLGKGLQLVNILRDLPRDLRSGRCYLPRAELAESGMKPEDLLDSAHEWKVRPLYDRWCARALDHLTAGWRYTNRLPGDQWRLRLACAWPVLLGVRTLEKLRSGEFLESSRRIKVSRPEVRSILFRSVVRLPFRGSWQRLFPAFPNS
ncbi:MAG: squalene/phytoene synthase family protein [Verrucomicrobiales bacterium]|nr:squalene/phytoene synthase family protein [Verrucomicrobiales bacterium]